MRAKSAVTCSAAALVWILAAPNWAAAVFGCATIVSVLAVTVWVLSDPARTRRAVEIIKAIFGGSA